MTWENILSPIELGTVALPNRIVFRAHRTNLAVRGKVTDSLIAYYLERALGGCGALIIGDLTLHPGDRPYEKMLEIFSDSTITGLGNLTRTIHDKSDSRVFAQMNHRGFQSSGMVSRLPIWGPEALADVVHGEVALKMTAKEIGELTSAYGRAAARLRDAGFDGVEVSIGPDSILRQFLSPLTNFRQDEYGGDLLNRLRLSIEVLKEIRSRAGAGFSVGVQLCLDEIFYGGLSAEEALQAAQEIEKNELTDFFNTTVGTYYNLYLVQASMHHPTCFTLDKVESLKNTVQKPVFAANRITDTTMAEDILEQGKADIIGWIRPLICDPCLPNKLKENRADHIISCVYDNQDCVGRTARNRSVGCIQNPWAGRELIEVDVNRAPREHVKKVVIVGAGPAGLKAALECASRGHDVQVFERDAEPGGQIRLAKKGAGRSELGGVVDNLLHQMKTMGVPLITGREMATESILAQNPDVVICATGSFPRSKPVAGNYGPPTVVTVRQVLNEDYPIGEKVLLVDEDGGHQATAAAEFLADQGKKVDIVTSELFVGMDLAVTGDLYNTRQRLLQKGSEFFCDRVVEEIQDTVVRVADRFTHARSTFYGYDTVVMAMGNVPDDALYKSLKGKVPHVYRIGDCVTPRKIDSAIREACDAALLINRHMNTGRA